MSEKLNLLSNSSDSDVEMQNAPHLSASEASIANDIEMTFKDDPQSSREEKVDSDPISAESDALHPIALLMDELKHSDVSLRLNAIKRLSIIALALGPERSRTELMPFLQESGLDEEDEILYTLAEELGGFVDYVGGPEYAHCLFAPLEPLCGAEEPLIRNKTIESLSKIFDMISNAHIEQYFYPLLTKLSSASWYTNRMSATALYSICYKKMPPSIQNELLNAFVHLVQDDTPMVRRAAATHFPDMVPLVSHQELIDEFYPAFLQISQDEQDSVRLLSIRVLVVLSQVFDQKERKEMIQPVAQSLFADHSWRVRYMVADQFAAIAEAVKNVDMIDDTLAAFSKLLRDYEAEVRTAATSQLPAFCALLTTQQIVNFIFPALKDLIADKSPYVRSSLALHISELASIIGRDETLTTLMPLLMLLLKDEHADVRLNIISKLEKVNEVVGIETLGESLLPAVVDLAGDKQWRVRLAIIEHTPLLASQLGQDFFNVSLCSLSLSLLSDQVYAVREASVKSIKDITAIFGVAWAKKHILPKLEERAKINNYLYRMTTLFVIQAFIELVDEETLASDLLPVVAKLATDPVPNVRFNAAKVFSSIGVKLKALGSEALISAKILPILEILCKDSDADVQYYAQNALLKGKSTLLCLSLIA